MNEALYFIPIIAEALRQPAVEPALHDAFARIEDMGRDPALRVGYRQFLRFMEEVRRALMDNEPQESPGQTFVDCERSSPLELWLERGEMHIGAMGIDRIPRKVTFRDLRPGAYRLRTDTGRTLWEATLTSRELVWAEAFPGQGLPLAAQTGRQPVAPSMEALALDGAMTIRVYPDLEGGVLVISVDDRRPMS